MAGNLRKAMGIGSKEPDLAKRIQPETEGSQMAHAAAAAALVPVGLTAFAVSAYIRCTLCPSLQSYSPQPLSSVSTVKTILSALNFAPASNGVVSLQGLPIGKRAESDSVCHPVVGCTAAPYLSVLGNVTQTVYHIYYHMQADLRQLADPGAQPSSFGTAHQQYVLQHMQKSVAALSAMEHAAALNIIQASLECLRFARRQLHLAWFLCQSACHRISHVCWPSHACTVPVQGLHLLNITAISVGNAGSTSPS